MTITAENVTAYFLRSEEGKVIENLRIRIQASNASTGGTLMAGEAVNPGPGGPPLHTHRSHDELYLVLEGTYRFKINDEEYEGGPGTFAYAPRGTTHTFASVGPGQGRIFCITLPGLEEFLQQMAALSERGADEKQMLELFQNFDSEINGPPLV